MVNSESITPAELFQYASEHPFEDPLDRARLALWYGLWLAFETPERMYGNYLIGAAVPRDELSVLAKKYREQSTIPTSDRVLARIAREDWDGMRILDIGCGSDKNSFLFGTNPPTVARYLASKGAIVVGIDNDYIDPRVGDVYMHIRANIDPHSPTASLAPILASAGMTEPFDFIFTRRMMGSPSNYLPFSGSVSPPLEMFAQALVVEDSLPYAHGETVTDRIQDVFRQYHEDVIFAAASGVLSTTGGVCMLVDQPTSFVFTNNDYLINGQTIKRV